MFCLFQIELLVNYPYLLGIPLNRSQLVVVSFVNLFIFYGYFNVLESTPLIPISALDVEIIAF